MKITQRAETFIPITCDSKLAKKEKEKETGFSVQKV